MEKGLKNLNQAYRSAQKKQGTGTYDEDHGDSGIGHSDVDEEHEERVPSSALSDMADTGYQFRSSYAQRQHQRVPSIQNMLQHQPAGPAYSFQAQGASLLDKPFRV